MICEAWVTLLASFKLAAFSALKDCGVTLLEVFTFALDSWAASESWRPCEAVDCWDLRRPDHATQLSNCCKLVLGCIEAKICK